MGPEDSTKLAKNIVRRHSTGPSLSIASSPVPLEDRNDRSRTNRGIDWNEKGSLVASCEDFMLLIRPWPCLPGYLPELRISSQDLRVDGISGLDDDGSIMRH